MMADLIETRAMDVETIVPEFADGTVAAVFDRLPTTVRGKLLRVRALIFETAAEQDGVGQIEETLKWGQPAYLTSETGSGSTVRIDAVKGEADGFAVYFHCQTNLVQTFRQLYPERFDFEGNRALRFRAGDDLPETELKHCLALALTYHRRRATARGKS
jgi:hypothetical protein